LAKAVDEKEKARLTKLFDKVDQNKDGKLTTAEFEQFKANYEVIPEETNEETNES
jgi:Ca2+-binding EF-hand superfamily protein